MFRDILLYNPNAFTEADISLLVAGNETNRVRLLVDVLFRRPHVSRCLLWPENGVCSCFMLISLVGRRLCAYRRTSREPERFSGR